MLGLETKYDSSIYIDEKEKWKDLRNDTNNDIRRLRGKKNMLNIVWMGNLFNFINKGTFQLELSKKQSKETEINDKLKKLPSTTILIQVHPQWLYLNL